MSSADFIAGGVAFIVMLRIVGVWLGHQYRCAPMRRARIVCGVILYTLAALAIMVGVIGIRR